MQVLWQSLKPGGIYVVEDISENYIEKPFLDKGTFTEFMKNAIDIVQCRHAPLISSYPCSWFMHDQERRYLMSNMIFLLCRMKPNYMGPDSPVRKEFQDFCAANPMDSKILLNCSYISARRM